jgi:hypothetical protein
MPLASVSSAPNSWFPFLGRRLKRKYIATMPETTTPRTAGNKIRRAIGMEMSLSWAEFVSFWANWILIGALVVGVLATLGIVVSANVKEAHWEQERRDSNERISTNAVETNRARESAAQANERAAEANLKAETERVERLKLEAKLAPRTLTLAQQLIASEQVEQFAPQPFQFLSYQDNKEERDLALMIGRLLLNAGWQGRKPKGFLLAELFEGVTLMLTTENADRFRPAAEALAAALNAQGITTEVIVNPKITDLNDFIIIRIGKKP